jgi:2TM domain
MTDENQRREAAIKRVKAKRGFRLHVAIYALVNLLLIVIWALTGAGYFWPIWPILGWGIAVGVHYWAMFQRRRLLTSCARGRLPGWRRTIVRIGEIENENRFHFACRILTL